MQDRDFQGERDTQKVILSADTWQGTSLLVHLQGDFQGYCARLEQRG
jgi:hypothetical protein